MTALHLLQDLKSKAPGGNRVAREIAILLGDACYRPDVITHTPGIANELTDALPRRLDPTRAKDWPIPSCLADVTPTAVPRRDASCSFL